MLKIVALKLKKVKMLSPSRFTVNPILLPVENDPFRSQLSTLTFLHWPPFSIRPAVSSESGRRRFDNWCFARHSCLRHLAVVAKSASNAQVTMSRNLNFSATQCWKITQKSLSLQTLRAKRAAFIFKPNPTLTQPNPVFESISKSLSFQTLRAMRAMFIFNLNPNLT